MRVLKRNVGDKVRVHNAPDAHVFGDGVVVPTGEGGTPFETGAGVATDTTVVGKYKSPDGTETTASVTHDATGIYYFDLPLTTGGWWYARLDGTVTIVAADELAIDVEDSHFSSP